MRSSFEHIVVPIDLGEISLVRLRLAVDLAVQFKANLTGVAARTASHRYGHGKGGIITTQMIDSEKRHALYELTRARARFLQVADAVQRIQFFCEMMEPEDLFLSKSRTSDLVICSRSYDGGLDDWFANLSPATLLTRLGCPLLIAPYEYQGSIGNRIVVAWKDTREARRTIRESWPFLKACQSVVVVSVGSNDEAQGATDIADFLIGRGINAKQLLIDKRHPRVSAEISAIVDDEGSDLIVAGARYHAQFRELFFGSVTQDMLSNTNVSCFLTG